ncbi:lysophospholipid acyltransferase family protein [[Mycobacterium] vasticus]|uniref:Lysophospholipid acyltransferase family protein n=1 Tax=[Mycobacterium] vasticus TaxID=2875777 RepID=A0ABU5YZG2_9MYCO|nr:lysophospholipid acyltransferase family protein [Mycolicibacter sp. MYC017]MEB3070542.1 lysophospholipid acyltransferase family protein [Mycolicibacter sp. MYC017]
MADQPDQHDSAAWLALRDPAYVAKVIPPLRAAVKGYFRSEVHGLEHIPDGGALLVSNHSGGMVPMDVPVVVVAFYDHFGTERPFYILAHDGLMQLGKSVLGPAGFMPANRDNAIAALRSGATTMVFPGGDHEVFRPTREANKIDFAGRKGYVRTALDAGVPIVPVVSIGGQEQLLVLSRGDRLARLLRLDKLIRLNVVPIIVGFPFGLTPGFVPSLPLPAKIVTSILEPIRIEDEFGPNPDIDEVDRVVRARMQDALDELASRRRFPIIG